MAFLLSILDYFFISSRLDHNEMFFFLKQLSTIATATRVKTTERVTTLYTATSARVLMVLMEQTVKKV